MTAQRFDFLTRTVEAKTIQAWRVDLVSERGITRVVNMLGNDMGAVVDAAEKYHQAQVVCVARNPERDINTADFATDFDKMNTHWEAELPYPIQQWQAGASLKGEGFDYVALSSASALSAGTFDNSKSMYSYTRMGLQAHTQAVFNGVIETGLPVLDFRIIK